MVYLAGHPLQLPTEPSSAPRAEAYAQSLAAETAETEQLLEARRTEVAAGTMHTTVAELVRLHDRLRGMEDLQVPSATPGSPLRGHTHRTERARERYWWTYTGCGNAPASNHPRMRPNYPPTAWLSRLRVARQGYLAPNDHGGAGGQVAFSYCRSLYGTSVDVSTKA
jgi:hypothetical protein